MERLKWIITGILYLSGAIGLVVTHMAVEGVLEVFGTDSVLSSGGAVPVTTPAAIRVMELSAPLCLGTLAATLVLLVVVAKRARSTEAKRFWIAVLGALNLYVAMFVLMQTVVGFFWLPRLINTPQPATITWVHDHSPAQATIAAFAHAAGST